MFYSLSSLLHVLAASAASIPFVAAQITTIIDELYAKVSPAAAPPGYNIEGGSVFTNFATAYDKKQFFLLKTKSYVYEKPESEPVSVSLLNWCSDLTFSDFSNSNSSHVGYAGRCVRMWLTGYADALATGAQLPWNVFRNSTFVSTAGVSAVYVEQHNIFEGQYHSNTDDNTYRYWDDGRKIVPTIGSEGHDEGDMSPNAATASWSSFGEITWMSIEEVAQLLNTTVHDFSPEKFKQVYKETWVKDHEDEAALDNPNAEAELEIIEEVQNETDSADGTTAPAAPGTAEDGVTDPIDDSASGRKLASVAARFASAALRVFGI